MIKINNKKQCSGCSACSTICPKECIKLVEDEEGFLYPRVDVKQCVNCGMCEKVCPFINRTINNNDINLAYAIKNKSDDLRKKASSGAVFYELARETILKGGVVYGVEFECDYRSIKHTRIDSIDKLDSITKSKYLQSEVNRTFYECKLDLLKGRRVLFSGTPCQINGLLNYLGKYYENLLTVEVVCHGVPSKKLYDEYLLYLQSKYKGKVSSFNFRRKLLNGDKFGVFYEENKVKVFEPISKNLYMKYFLTDVALRPSCYDCKSKNTGRPDITLADFWGIQNVCGDFSDELGVSLVIIHNQTAKEMLKNDYLNIVEVPTSDSLKSNPSYYKSSNKPKNRDKFYLNNPFSLRNRIKLQVITYKNTVFRKVKSVIKRIFILFKILPKNSESSQSRDLIYGVEIVLQQNNE